MWPYPSTHVGTPSHLGHMDRVAATMPSQAHGGAAQEAPDIGQWEGSLSECLFFSIDPQKFIDGSTSSPGCSVINENPGLFKFWADPVKPWITNKGPKAAAWSRGKRNNLAVNLFA